MKLLLIWILALLYRFQELPVLAKRNGNAFPLSPAKTVILFVRPGVFILCWGIIVGIIRRLFRFYRLSPLAGSSSGFTLL